MRRLMRLVVLGAVVALLSTACVRPAGIDGDLSDDWVVAAEPTQTVPTAGRCQVTNTSASMLLIGYSPVDCTQSHLVETAHVGTFTGPAAERTSPPPAGSPERRQALAECEAKTREYLGDDWRAGRIMMHVVLPTTRGWDGGARWFLCDVNQVVAVYDYSMIQRTGSLAGALKAPSPLRHECLQYDEKKYTTTPVDCTKVHNAEFVGVFTAPDIPYPDGDDGRRLFIDGCNKVLAAFLGTTNVRAVDQRSGLFWRPPAKAEWADGDRGTPCFVWSADEKLTRSLKGVGLGGLR